MSFQNLIRCKYIPSKVENQSLLLFFPRFNCSVRLQIAYAGPPIGLAILPVLELERVLARHSTGYSFYHLGLYCCAMSLSFQKWVREGANPWVFFLPPSLSVIHFNRRCKMFQHLKDLWWKTHNPLPQKI